MATYKRIGNMARKRIALSVGPEYHENLSNSLNIKIEPLRLLLMNY